MKTVYLVRHAKSSWKNPDLNDFDRPLNKRGKRDAPFMGRRLRLQNITPDLLISSPAKRAAKTAKILAEEMNFPKKKIEWEETIYMLGTKEILDIIHRTSDEHKSIMIVGHNPGLNFTAEYLSGQDLENIPTCGIFSMEFDVRSWKDVSRGLGKTLFFDYPKKHSISLKK